MACPTAGSPSSGGRTGTQLQVSRGEAERNHEARKLGTVNPCSGTCRGSGGMTSHGHRPRQLQLAIAVSSVRVIVNALRLRTQKVG